MMAGERCGVKEGFCLFPFKARDKKAGLRMDGNDTGLWHGAQIRGREGIISGKRYFGEDQSENGV